MSSEPILCGTIAIAAVAQCQRLLLLQWKQIDAVKKIAAAAEQCERPTTECKPLRDDSDG